MRAWQGTGATDYAGGYLELMAGDVTGLFAMTSVSMRRHPQGHGHFRLERRDASGNYKGTLAYYDDLDGWNFRTAASASATTTAEHLRITPSGNVGIGTTSPARQLHVQAAGRTRLRIEVRSCPCPFPCVSHCLMFPVTRVAHVAGDGGDGLCWQ